MHSPRYDDMLVKYGSDIMRAWPHANYLWRVLGEVVSSHVANIKHPRIIDLGAGSGSLTKYLPTHADLTLVDCSPIACADLESLTRVRPNTKFVCSNLFSALGVIASDFDVPTLQQAHQQKLRARQSQVQQSNTYCNNAADCNYANNKYDVVLSSWVYHNLTLAERTQYLFGAYRVLNTGGMIAFVDKFLPHSILKNIDEYNALLNRINSNVSEPARSRIIAHEREDYSMCIHETEITARLAKQFSNVTTHKRIGRDVVLTAIQDSRLGDCE